MENISGLNLIRTGATSPDFLLLIRELDAGLHENYGDEMDFFGQFNKVDDIKHVIVAYVDGNPAGCGSIKQFEPAVAEVKRMFVRPQNRGQGIAGKILNELESWAKEVDFAATVLETGTLQTEAIKLYQKKGYEVIENYGQYKGVESSICFSKKLV